MMPFPFFRLTLLAVALIAQLYLFARAARFIRSSRRSRRFKSIAVILAGLAMAMLSGASAYIMFRPVLWVNAPTAAQVLLFYPPAIWSIGSMASALLLFLTRCLGRLANFVAKIIRRMTHRPKPALPDPVRRRLLRAGVAGIAVAPFFVAGYGVTHARRPCDIAVVNLPFGRTLRVVQLTDIHAGIYMTEREMRRYSDMVRELRPDLFVLTGDFVSNSLSFLPGCLREMARIETRYGTYAVLGNHEHWYGWPREIHRYFRECKVPLLQNSREVIQTDQGPFAVAGIDDLRAGLPDLHAAVAGLVPSIPILLLSHRPEIFPEAVDRGIGLTLAGHYHGGQIKLSLAGKDLSIAHFRTLYPEGLYRENDSYLYVSRGIGTTFTPVRLNAPPEITVLQLT
jgi:uncharacterized protein